jgi:hypothetical protein
MQMHVLVIMSTRWPALPLDAWRSTRDTLHRYAQIIGKVQLALTPVVNHFWNVTLHVTARGLATSALRYGDQTFDIELDFLEHRVVIRTSDGAVETQPLRPLAVADFYRELLATLERLGIYVHIWDHPVEILTEAIPFPTDHVHAAYDREYVERFFRVLAGAEEILDEFRSRFMGKCSGTGFYWGTFDLSVARYSGRPVINPPIGNRIEREAYSHEVSEVGFWPGDAVYNAPAFYALHYPMPDAYPTAAIRPIEASWQERSRCFVLPYEDIRARDLRAKALEFFQSTYEVGAMLAGWNRAELERCVPAGAALSRAG